MTVFGDGLTGMRTGVPKTSIVKSASVAEPVVDEIPVTNDDELTAVGLRSTIEPSVMLRPSRSEAASASVILGASTIAAALSKNPSLVTLKGPTVVLKEMRRLDWASFGGAETAADSSGPRSTGSSDTGRATSRTVDELSALMTAALAGDAASVEAAKAVAAKAPTPVISYRLSLMILTPLAWMTFVPAATAVLSLTPAPPTQHRWLRGCLGANRQ
jgi:membrane-associated protease RseP (regulator of RpoE activity)